MFSKGLPTFKQDFKNGKLRKKKKKKRKLTGVLSSSTSSSYPKSKQPKEAEKLLVQHHPSVCHIKGRWCVSNLNVLLRRKPINPLGMGRPPRKHDPVKCIITLRKKKVHSTLTHFRIWTYFIIRSSYSLSKDMDDGCSLAEILSLQWPIFLIISPQTSDVF